MRLDYLVKNGVEAQKIIVSTFNVEAGIQLKEKVRSVMGGVAAEKMMISNIDKIAFQFYIRYFRKNYYIGVREYCREFLCFLRTKEGVEKIIKYYKYLFFDEFQDISQTQYEILLEFYKNGVKIIVIGDDA